MTAWKTRYSAISEWMQKHHIRGIYLMIVLYVIVVAMRNSSFLTVGNWVNLLRQVAVYGIGACGITLIMLTGRTDLSAGMMLTFLANISCYYVTPAVQNQALAIVMPLLIGLVTWYLRSTTRKSEREYGMPGWKKGWVRRNWAL